MKNIINELWQRNTVLREDSRNKSTEMKHLMEYMSRHHDDMLKSMPSKNRQRKKFKSLTNLKKSCIIQYANANGNIVRNNE